MRDFSFAFRFAVIMMGGRIFSGYVSHQVLGLSKGGFAMLPGSVFTERLLKLALFVFAFSAILIAQSTTDGAVAGTVFDSTGAVVPGAHVVIHNNGTNAEESATADESGYYRVIHLQPGSYTVTVTKQGFAPHKNSNVIVQVGALTDVSPKLAVGGTAETVDVTAEAPQINTTSQEFAGTLNQVAIANLPINGGRWSNFALLTPGVVADASGFGLLSFRGISTLLNNNTVDGADNNQAFFSEERGRTRAGYSTPKAAVDEFQVNTSDYSAEYGRAAGGVINTVTKSGTNTIHGEGYFYDRDNVWGAANAFTTEFVPSSTPGVFNKVNFKPTDWRKMAGFSVGGPLIKDKLFLQVTYDWYHRNFPGTAVASNPNVFFATTPATFVAFAQHLNGLPSTTAPSASQLTAATTTYNNDLNALSTLLGLVPRFGAQNIILPRLDWQINSKNHASFSVNRMRWNSPGGIQTTSTVTRGIASFGNDFVKDTWGVAKLESAITSTIANELRFQYGRDLEFEFSQPPAPYELANLVNAPTFTNPLGLPPTVSITNGFTFGVPNFLQRSFFPDESRTQVADTINWNRGKHNLKFGVDISHVNDNSQNLFNGFGSYSYSSVLNYLSDLNVPHGCATGPTAVPTLPCYSSFSQGLGLAGLEFTTQDVAFFVADDWKILPRLSLSLGLRWDDELMPGPRPNLLNPAVAQTQQLPKDQNNFGPRVGFAWDIPWIKDTVLRGGYGIYYGRIINSAIFNALINTGMPGSQVSVSFTPSPTSPTFPQVFTTLSGQGKNIVFFDSHFQNPQIHEIDLAMDHNLGWGTVLSVSFLASLGRQLPGFADINICTGAGVPAPTCAAPGTITYTISGGGPLGSGTLTEPLFKQRANPAFGSMTDIFSGINSKYTGLALELKHRMSHHIQFGASYTFSRAIDFGQNQSTFSDTNDLLIPFNIGAEKGTSIDDIPHRFVVNAVVTSPWKQQGVLGWFTNDWEFAPIYQWQYGAPYSALTAGTPAGAIGSSINGSGGANRIDALGRNTFRQPSVWAADMRLAKTFTFRERYRLELSGDFFNIANKQDVTGINNTAYIISGANLNFNAPFGSITAANGSSFTYTPRQIQLGVRVKF
jgi:hypothetical protein